MFTLSWRTFTLPKVSGRVAFRWIAAACQAFTILVTWQLWQVRPMPPLLPALPLPTFDMGALLLISVALILIRPRIGLIVHTVLLIYAMLTDQTRLQPEFVSLAFLLWGTLDHPAAQTVARYHLIALWTWAGINKLLSPAFLAGTGRSMFSVLMGFFPDEVVRQGGYIIALSELSLGILALIPRTRKFAAWMAFGLHMGILFTLLRISWNSAVWAWNVALAFAGFAFLWAWKENIFKTILAQRWAVRLIAVFLLISPAGFYIGAMDAYLAHNLYSSNTADANAAISPNMSWSILNVPMPPEHRIFEQFFRLTCETGQRMSIRDTRPYFVANGLGTRTLECTAG